MSLGSWGQSVPDSRIRIDPEFDARPDNERGRRTAWFAIAGLVVAAVIFGWFLAVPVGTDPIDQEAVAASTSLATVPTTEATVVEAVVEPHPPVLQSSTMADVGSALSDAIPGFTDEITMLATPPESFKVVRWSPSEAATELVFSLDRIAEYGCLPEGLDASGSRFARTRRDGTLMVHSIADAPGESAKSESVGLNVGSVAWHETVPGSLAWISCARSESSPSTLYSLDVSDLTAEPVPLWTFDQSCSDGVWLESWTNDGALVGSLLEESSEQILIGPDGKIVPFHAASQPLVTGAEHEYRLAVPGLGIDEPVGDVAWAPDGTLVAAIVDEFWDTDVPRLCVMDVETGQQIAEVSEHGSDIIAMAWSSDSRFLLYELWNFDSERGGLVMYDMVTNTTTRVPLAEIVDEIRTSAAS